ncbi:hypothetical protein [Corynebacterium sp. HMSC14H10]|uniref:hypothetical protein n=1 Tax=Corynebacterium sp. HMSC14H10 TaxID=1581103 RepID=UPI0008A579AD|nr:hypothetical protein [Corynebacterium sp. HMSC14H10]OFU60012.1 hypothetical protein HMPREF3135_08905 [Corynebacterium sp. HMSC14H10]
MQTSTVDATVESLTEIKAELEAAALAGYNDISDPHYAAAGFTALQHSEAILSPENARWKRESARNLLDSGYSLASTASLVGVSNRTVAAWSSSDPTPRHVVPLGDLTPVDDAANHVGVAMLIPALAGLGRALGSITDEAAKDNPAKSAAITLLAVASPSPIYNYHLARALAGLHLRGATLETLARGVGRSTSWVKARIASTGASHWVEAEREKRNTP